MPKKGSDKEIIAPFVRVELREPLRQLVAEGGAEEKKEVNDYKSKVIDDNGFNPVWNESFTFSFEELENAMLVIKVFDMDKLSTTLLGQRAIALGCLRQGYRVIEMLDKNFKMIPQSYICCNIELTIF